MRRILIVDDEPEICLLLSTVLRGAGYAVETAPDGRAALESIAASPPDLLITDLIMPRLSGWSLFSRVRRQAPTLPIIVLSGADAGYQKQETPLPDHAVFLRKPFEIDRLLTIVARLTGIGSGLDTMPATNDDEGPKNR